MKGSISPGCLAALAAFAVISCRPATEEEHADATTVEAGETPVAATPAAESPNELTCSYPVNADDTAASLQQRFGKNARAETIYGPEGIELPGVALWPDDPRRRVEVVFSEEGEHLLSFAGVSGQSTTWHLAGLTLGDPLAKAREVNGKPFELWGFSWDYGGYASNLEGGKLGALPGGCSAILRFDVPEDAEVPSELLGEVRLSSDDAVLAGANARLVELSVTFARD